MSEIWNMEFMSQIKKQIYFDTKYKFLLVANIYHHYDRDESLMVLVIEIATLSGLTVVDVEKFKCEIAFRLSTWNIELANNISPDSDKTIIVYHAKNMVNGVKPKRYMIVLPFSE